MASSNQNPNVKEIPSSSSICVKSPSIIRTVSSPGRMIWLRKSAAVLRRHWRNSLTSTALPLLTNFLIQLIEETSMKLTDNTIFITGGGTGIGRGLAEGLHKLVNKVIISGRRKEHLDATTMANPGMDSVELDIADPANITAVTKKLVADYPALNVLINNAGVMLI